MKTILVIEDDTAVRENTTEILELSGYSVLTAANGKLGIEKAFKTQPDLVVCDIMMPKTDGYGVLEALGENETTRSIPFVFLSAKTEHKEIRKGMDLGADDYLTKPFEESDLLSAIESRLAKADILSSGEPSVPSLSPDEEDEMRNLNALKNHFDDNGKLSTYKKGTFIYKEGEHSNLVYLILKGVVKIHQMDEKGKELTTVLHKADDFLGLNSFEKNTPYKETATAVEGTELVSLSKQDLKRILEENKHLAMELLDVMTDNLSEIKRQLLQMAFSSVKRKTAQTILQFVNVLDKKSSDNIRISRADLASVAGIATESLIRTLSSFKNDGLIEIEGRNIKILDIQSLKEME